MEHIVEYFCEMSADNIQNGDGNVRIPVSIVSAAQTAVYNYETREILAGQSVLHVSPQDGFGTVYRREFDGSFTEIPVSVGDRVIVVCPQSDCLFQAGAQMVIDRHGKPVAAGVGVLLGMWHVLREMDAGPAPEPPAEPTPEPGAPFEP
jgi:hypothetical protein